MAEKPYVCGSYIPAGNLTAEIVETLDFHKITHAFLAFSVLHENSEKQYVPFFSEGLKNGIALVRERIKALQAQTKLLISIGGWGAGYFCEASSTAENRKAFAGECKKLLDEFELDGFDMDWEFPGVASEGVHACAHCASDFVLLCREIKKAIGDRLLTAAVGSDHWEKLDNRALNEILDLVNVMTYDMNTFAHSSMSCTSRAMNGWASHGIDRNKLVLGVPFYARCENPAYEWKGYDELMNLAAEGCAQLLSTEDQEYAVLDGNKLSIDTPHSIRKKICFIRQNHFAGIFNWQELTDKNGELRRAMFEIFSS